ncbi:hypothetical protein L207DRAFT_512835 [Hyaloscypha variabilis F]|uniref:FIST domain-containing protein n=1 Tax=Hyaloscypha variabilis (strain UAMH 11265 / GT02V1 / F) TaxID=1149755 RepID=A0A2J6RMY2_HYAVF|nr:hypothetical protein L207DRAFT_512835 [Hyaloscypha variabilis F]
MRKALIRQARWPSLRSLHTESANKIRKGTNKHDLSLAVRQVTISIKQPEQATIKSVLDAFTAFKRPIREVQGTPELEHHTIFILATPTFASWLEASSEFIPQALQRVFGTSSPVEADVVCGVCDGLAPRSLSMKTLTGTGFSVWHKPSKVENLWKNNDTGSSPNMQSTLTISARSPYQATLTLPLANTLFQNGRHSTLLLSRWKSNGDSFQIERDQIEKKNVTMNLFVREGQFPRHVIPCVPLTPLRRIHSGLGNIVRTINFGRKGESDIGPASRELETSVGEYLAKGGNDQRTIDVWALVLPQDPRSRQAGRQGPVKQILTTDMDALRAIISPSTSKGLCYVGTLINEGARLVRVLSGGGGWGVKEGLLSLDPQTTYSDSNESRYDYSEGSLDERQISALGSLAREGAFIQFLVATKLDEDTAITTLQGNEHSSDDFRRHATVVGVVPSTIDDVHDEQQQIPTISDIQIYPGHFGMVSESGIFLRRGAKKMDMGEDIRSIETKVDLPFSYFYQEYRKRERKFSRTDKEVERLTSTDEPCSTAQSV